MAKISENTEVALPLRNIISLIVGASIATWHTLVLLKD